MRDMKPILDEIEELKQKNYKLKSKLCKIKAMVIDWENNNYMSGDDAIKDIKDVLE